MMRSLLITAAAVLVAGTAPAQSVPELRFRSGGALLRIESKTHQALPELAASWEVDPRGRWITFHLRPGVNRNAVVSAIVRALDPKQNAGAGHPFRVLTWPPRIATAAPNMISVDFDAPVPGLLQLFADVRIPGEVHGD
jgi:ABC-type transport system substrate-binding protein